MKCGITRASVASAIIGDQVLFRTSQQWLSQEQAEQQNSTSLAAWMELVGFY
jgi:hypothetical protein